MKVNAMGNVFFNLIAFGFLDIFLIGPLLEIAFPMGVDPGRCCGCCLRYLTELLGGVVVVQKNFVGRDQLDFAHCLQGALIDRGKGFDGFNLNVEKTDAVRVFMLWAEHVEDVSPHGKMPGLFNDRITFVPHEDELLNELIPVDQVIFGYRDVE
ncbi:MAG: hypothetical protein ACD_62C00396G0002 [uncultured bacterium]|nr:MAG: hypothetical protein ACD_62C00396G0002 [uncultured bacterium]